VSKIEAEKALALVTNLLLTSREWSQPMNMKPNANNAVSRSLEIDNTTLRLRCNVAERDVAKSIPEARWNPFARAWEYPNQPAIIDQIISKFPCISLPESIRPPRPVPEPIKETVTVTLPVKAVPFKHQIDAYHFACRCLGVM